MNNILIFCGVLMIITLFFLILTVVDKKQSSNIVYTVNLFGYDTYMLAECESPMIHAEISKRSRYADEKFAETVYVVEEPDFFRAVALINNWFKSNNVNTEDVKYPNCCRYIKDYLGN